MKLNEREMLSIRLLYATGATQSEIAKRYKVSQFTISRVLASPKKARNVV